MKVQRTLRKSIVDMQPQDVYSISAINNALRIQQKVGNVVFNTVRNFISSSGNGTNNLSCL